MPTLTASTTLIIGAGSPAAETREIALLPARPPGSPGTGRLVHPLLGTFDYPYAPDEWRGIDTDVLIPPVWANVKTLSGAANTLWRGQLRDVLVVERWRGESGLSMPLAMLRWLFAAWQNPPDPATGYVQWWPSYTSERGFQAILADLTVGGQGITLDALTRQGWVSGVVELTLRLGGRL